MATQVSATEPVVARAAPKPGGPSGRLRVLFFTSTLGGGGAEKHLLRVVNHLDRQRFDVALALAKPCGEFESELSADVRKYHLNRSAAGSTTVRMFQAIKPLREVIRRE